jgi:hypothetical protein
MTRCVNCGEKKPPGDFYDDWRLPGGKSHECKQCTIERTNKNREKRQKISTNDKRNQKGRTRGHVGSDEG